jgi:hypothetical protein
LKVDKVTNEERIERRNRAVQIMMRSEPVRAIVGEPEYFRVQKQEGFVYWIEYAPRAIDPRSVIVLMRDPMGYEPMVVRS